MPLNLELKSKVSSHSKIMQYLKEIDAEFANELNQKDVYYKIKDGLLKLRIENGQQTLIKYNRDEKGKERWSEYYLLKISEGDGEKMFGKIFKIETIVEKKRLLYMYDNTRVHLDKVKNLGTFIELETLVLSGKKNASKRFYKIIDLLHLDLKKQIKKSYRDLLIEKNK
ncbi:MAG TPA: class IV adenylate cyclase [Ignavibacteriaceae bacterium]|nr:class IV adenylate cyclase [Ignavibacteriaceae bacterium]